MKLMNISVSVNRERYEISVNMIMTPVVFYIFVFVCLYACNAAGNGCNALSNIPRLYAITRP